MNTEPEEFFDIWKELGRRVYDDVKGQPMFHTLAQCLHLKAELILRFSKETDDPVLKRRCIEFLEWYGLHPEFPFNTRQSADDPLQQAIRVLPLESQLMLFHFLDDLAELVYVLNNRTIISAMLKIVDNCLKWSEQK